MLNILKRKCPHCGQRSINIFRISSRLSRCPNCSGLVMLHFWRNILLILPLLVFIIVILPTISANQENNLIIGTTSGILYYLIFYPLFVPIVAVTEKEEKKD